jgi:hypothetical protein
MLPSLSGRSTRPHTPTCGLEPSAEFGTSSAMLNTFLSAKKSLPVNAKLFRNPSRSKKNGSLRIPAKKT